MMLEGMSETIHDFAADAVTLRYTCDCGTELLITAGKTLREAPHDELRCPECGEALIKLRAALTAYQKFCEAVRLVEEGLGQKPAKLRLHVVLPDAPPKET